MNGLKMFKNQLLLIICFVGISVSSFGQTYNGKQKDINQILKNVEQFSAFFMAADVENLVNCYTIDGKIFPNNQKVLEGKEALKKYWTIPEDIKTIHHKITPSEITIKGKTAYDYGYYEGKTQLANGEISEWKGKYVIVWKKVGKEWKIYLDIWNQVK